jgi:AcrR family transcriptional regulator
MVRNRPRGIDDPGEADGRVRRGERNRAAIVDALLALVQEGQRKPPATDIAARAGVSVRSVFQHFEDLETLYAALVARQMERLRAYDVTFDAGEPFATRLNAFVDQRVRLYEAITPVRQAALLVAHESETLRAALAHTAQRHGREVAAVFAPELAAAAEPGELRAAVTVATSWEAWHRLRDDQRCSAAVARRVVTTIVTALVANAG